MCVDCNVVFYDNCFKSNYAIFYTFPGSILHYGDININTQQAVPLFLTVI